MVFSASLSTTVWISFLLWIPGGAHRDGSEASKSSLAAEVAVSRLAAEAVVDEGKEGGQRAGALVRNGAITSGWSSQGQHLMASAQMIGGAKTMMKIAAACVCFVVLWKLISKVDCFSKKLDCRRIRWIGKACLHCYDEFPAFRILVTVHCVQDIVSKGMLGDKSFKVIVAFNWSKFITTGTKDMRWDQTKGIEVPQGASECVIQLFSEGKIKDSMVGEYVLETKREMIDKQKFWGEKQKIKLDNKGKLVGTLLITFRHEDDPDSPGANLPIEGVDPESALALAVHEAFQELTKEGKIKKEKKKKPPPSDAGSGCSGITDSEEEYLEGTPKIEILARCITGPLREVGNDGKEKGKTFVRVVNCNYAELQGEDMEEEMVRQKKKAKEKGLSQIEKKWYWAWYEDKKAAFGKQSWHEPDGFIAMIAISGINRTPERNDQFVIKYKEDGQKKLLTYRREAGRGLDVWIDGLDLCFQECREDIKDKKAALEDAKQEKRAQEVMQEEKMKQLRQDNAEYIRKFGPPMNPDAWKAWFAHHQSGGATEEDCKRLYAEMQKASKVKAKAKSKG